MSKGSILLVDDDKDILELFQMTLLEDGYSVETARAHPAPTSPTTSTHSRN